MTAYLVTILTLVCIAIILGLAIGVDFDDEDYADKVAGRCRRKGLMVAPQDTGILLIPALNIEYEVAEKALDIFEESI